MSRRKEGKKEGDREKSFSTVWSDDWKVKFEHRRQLKWRESRFLGGREISSWLSKSLLRLGTLFNLVKGVTLVTQDLLHRRIQYCYWSRSPGCCKTRKEANLKCSRCWTTRALYLHGSLRVTYIETYKNNRPSSFSEVMPLGEWNACWLHALGEQHSYPSIYSPGVKIWVAIKTRHSHVPPPNDGGINS